MDYLDLSLLATCVAVMDEGGFTEAARSLGISQPAVSQHVSRLEKRLGNEIFIRVENRRQPQFTPFGVELVDEARNLLKAHQDAYRRLTRDAMTCVIGISTMSADFLSMSHVRQLGRLLKKRTTIRIENYSFTLRELIQSGEVDLAFALNFDDADTESNVGHIEYQWYGAPDRAFAPGVLPLITYGDERCRIHDLGIQRLTASGYAPKVVHQADSIEVACTAARTGVGIVFLNSLYSRGGLEARAELPGIPPVAIKMLKREGLALDVARWRDELLRAR